MNRQDIIKKLSIKYKEFYLLDQFIIEAHIYELNVVHLQGL